MLTPMPPDEPERLAELRSLRLLDRQAPAAIHRILRLVRQEFDFPIALATLVDSDRQWHMAKEGLDATQLPRAGAFCSHLLLEDAMLTVDDARGDPRFHGNPIVEGPPYVRCYAGAALIMPSGRRMGGLSVMGDAPRRLTPDQQARLRHYAQTASDVLAMHQDEQLLADAIFDTSAANRSDLRQLARISHDLRTPLGHILGFAELLADPSDAQAAQAQRQEYLAIIKESGGALIRLLDGAIADAKRASASDSPEGVVDLPNLLRSIERSFADVARRRRQTVTMIDRSAPDAPMAAVDAAAIRRIVNNLVANACAHAGEGASIQVRLHQDNVGGGAIVVTDDGPGIPDAVMARLGRPFLELPVPGAGTGLGLSNVVEIANDHGWRFALENRTEGGARATLSWNNGAAAADRTG